ncbi:hypothetical protein [Chondromyces crocatus]|uniref:Phage tail protein n=1 Tax=Chondromyces crocatus TaxID=52 RepID=A0A0K1EBM5_CHOCO|nr:hypothetical protein [Chondromyces crocatus]AKT38254.1 uncharacterized protein CMC5_023970 [Chondromyces crocatus]
MSDAIRVNGNQYDWGSIKVKILGEEFYGFTAVSHSQKRERAKAYGFGKHRAPRGRTRGRYSAEGKMTGWKSSVEALRAFLASQSPDGTNYGDVEFDIVIQYIEPDETPITEELFQCVVASEDASHEENTDPLKEEIGLDVMYIKKNGRTLFDNSDKTR